MIVECSEALCAGRRDEIELVVLVIEYWATHGLDQAVLRGHQPAASTHTWSLVFRVSDECSRPAVLGMDYDRLYG